jgi:hypothetical protein
MARKAAPEAAAMAITAAVVKRSADHARWTGELRFPSAVIRQSNECQAAGCDDDGGGGIDGDGVARRAVPVRRTDIDQKRNGNRTGRADAVERKRPGALAARDKTQRHGGACQHYIRRAFEAYRHGGAGEHARPRGGKARPVGPRDRGHQQHRKRDLNIMVVDAAGNELRVGRQAQHRAKQRDRRRGASGNTPGEKHGTRHGRNEPQHRPDGPHQAFGGRVVGEAVEYQEKSGKAGIDQARPVRVIAGGRTETRFVQVEPAVAGQELAHLHEPHGVIRVVEGLRRLRPVKDNKLHRNDEPSESEEQRDIGDGDVGGFAVEMFPVVGETATTLEPRNFAFGPRAGGEPTLGVTARTRGHW